MSPQSPGRRRAARASGRLTLLPFLLTPAGKIGVGATLTALVAGSLLIGAPLGSDSKPPASPGLSAAPADALPIQPLAHSGQTDETSITLEIGGVPIYLATGLAPDAQASGTGFAPVHTPDGVLPSAGLQPVADFGPSATQSVPARRSEGGNPPPRIATASPPLGAPTSPPSSSTPPALPASLGVPPGSGFLPPVDPYLPLPSSPGVSPGAEGPNPTTPSAAPHSPGETGIPAGPQPMPTQQPSPLASSEPPAYLPSAYLPSGHLPSGHLPNGTQPGLPSWLPPSASVPPSYETPLVQPPRQALAQLTTNTVPEPASLALSAAGLAGMMWMRRATGRLHRLRLG